MQNIIPNIIECEETFHQNKEGVGVVTKTFPLKLGITVYYDIFFFQHFICKKPVRLFFLLSNNFANSERIPIKIMREGPKSQKKSL